MLNSDLVRRKTIELSCKTGAGHLAPSLSVVDLLCELFSSYLSYNINDPEDDTRDRFILSKGHGAYSYYIILNSLGFIPDWEIDNFYSDESTLKGCLTADKKYMIEASTGSLGHGLPIAVGMALSFKIRNKSNKVVCIVGDGEMQEGSNFEALTLAARFKLDNLLIIVDANELQAMGKVADIGLDNKVLSSVLQAFEPGCFHNINGHDITQIKTAYNDFFNEKQSNFSLIFAHTVKGKGLQIIENSIKHHYRCPAEDGYNWEANND